VPVAQVLGCSRLTAAMPGPDRIEVEARAVICPCAKEITPIQPKAASTKWSALNASLTKLKDPGISFYLSKSQGNCPAV
jgi:hypothetical protein